MESELGCVLGDVGPLSCAAIDGSESMWKRAMQIEQRNQITKLDFDAVVHLPRPGTMDQSPISLLIVMCHGETVDYLASPRHGSGAQH